ncbi:MAG: hypothetical protein ABI128_06220 [Rhodanobacter sp.]
MIAEWLNVGVGAVNVLVTLYIARAVTKAGRNVVQMEQDRGIKDAWVEVDKTALADDADLALLDAMIHPDQCGEDPADKRKRWLAYMVLNPLEAAWTSAKAGNMQAGAVDSSERTMRALIRDPLVCQLIEGFVYGSDFRKRCLELRKAWLIETQAQEMPRPPSTCKTSPVQ